MKLTEKEANLERRKPRIAMRQKGKIGDQRLATCTVCKFGIFEHHMRVWTPIGLVHYDPCSLKVK